MCLCVPVEERDRVCVCVCVCVMVGESRERRDTESRATGKHHACVKLAHAFFFSLVSNPFFFSS